MTNTQRINGRRVDWVIPGSLYSAIRELHDKLLADTTPGRIPKSEEDFCLDLLKEGFFQVEKGYRKWQEDTGRVVIPKNIIL